MAWIIASALSLFLAGFLFYEADPARQQLAWGSDAANRGFLFRAAGWLMVFFALALSVAELGDLRGGAVWVGFLMVMPLTSLMLASWKRVFHQRASQVAATGLIVSLAVAGLGAIG